ncbi:hypothetical protein COZ78_01880 [bacterium (Candidatus Gribaldobacteria) CG_4_8_14_3_um_filter_42_11]|uniref:Uncharacterized protein n=1 Tax=bacterium (Candidatus Gribaldobacteria) CG_4_8_14_3_um_filter_42_11 TaxID=2014267 RepID=A0A2M7IYB9_9BACT|nr:MAG: hypothetical protein COZ78_01880 [bacterium (Candidatus Gribaldobacteria) CG_4_8_14_3_um_filter_42_11]
MSAPDAFSLVINVKGYYSLNYNIVALDTPDFPAYSRILLKQISYFNTVRVHLTYLSVARKFGLYLHPFR